MYATQSIIALGTTAALKADPNTHGGVNVATVITGGTGDIVVEATLSQDDGSGLFTGAAWVIVATYTAGTDDAVLTSIPGPVAAVRLNGALLTVGTAVIEVRQASRV